MAATQKAVGIARQLAEDLGLRTGLAVVSDIDANGNPTIALGNTSVGQQGAFVRVIQEATIQTDPVTYGAARVYTPHIIQLVVETSAVANVAILNSLTLAKVITDVTKFGTKVELYLSPNGNAVDVSDITGANLKATIQSDIWNPLTGQI